MKYEKYSEQIKKWPIEGKHILASYDDSSISVYQAYRPSIASYAVSKQKFGGEFSYTRMSWIKPNFLWMMYRSGWATKEGQERILEIRLSKQFFDEILLAAVPSSFDPKKFDTRDQWQLVVTKSDVRLQWDPDHDPGGKPLARRAVQLGLRGKMLHRFGQIEPIYISDITDFVIAQRSNITDYSSLLTPIEDVYIPNNRAAIAAVGIDSWFC